MLEKQKITPPEMARLWGIGQTKILNAIRRGELRAIDIAEPGSQRPRYLIDLADIAEFEKSRRVIPDDDLSTIQKVRRKSKKSVKNYF